MRQVVLIVILLSLPLGGAQVYRIGEDPGGDSSNQIAPGADAGAVLSNDRTDVRFLEFEQDDSSLLVRLGIGAVPSGTGGYLYRASFSIGGTSYFTCWAVQYTANEATVTQENVLGCSRFTSGTAVGPVTRAAGIVAADGAITWPVPRSAIGGAGLADIESASADTWFRGASNCCAGSTTHSQYLWNRADLAPDTGAFLGAYVAEAPSPAALQLNLTVAHNATTTVAGGVATFVLNLTASAPANVTFALDNGWNATGLEPWNGTGQLLRNVTIHVPLDAPLGNHTIGVEARAGNLTARIELLVEIAPAGQDPMEEPGTQGGPVDGGSQGAPLPAWLVVAAVLAARRRLAAPLHDLPR